MGNTPGELAAELKAFLLASDEDDLIAAAGSTAAAAVYSEPIVNEAQSSCASSSVSPATQRAQPDLSSYKDHLTVEFRSAAPKATPLSTLSAPANAAPSTDPLQEFSMPAKRDTAATITALAELAETISNCRRCPLGDTRLNAVPGEGNPSAELMFIGEGPGFEEDHKGRPFIGRAGQLLDKMIIAMGLKREDVFIANIVKCHPMNNPAEPESHGNDRAPNAGEIAVCRKYIERQIAAICPKYVVALGGVASKALISDTNSLGALRGKFHDLHLDSVELPRPVKILATYHPAALLRNPNWKKDAWADLQMVMSEMGLKPAK